ncbi:hypothetical protein BJ508DRAFT_40664 [Ascobolus immersus RN42]|uniref:Uncharacterized protein n=1 Tax=Ascobolus immersus RN42 TaxID=1160509 RepID=A0A3N4HNH1_ASCIM|nr:hypothetical protein BJ508DRAFT_40664 [Ascobolus immersus RN42]
MLNVGMLEYRLWMGMKARVVISLLGLDTVCGFVSYFALLGSSVARIGTVCLDYFLSCAGLPCFLFS